MYNKNQRNFPQDWEKLLTRFAASCNKISGIPVSCVFLCSFLWAYSSSGRKYAPPEELPQKSFRSFSLSANSLFMGFPLKDWLLKFFSRVFILSAGIYVFSAMAVYFSASSEFSLCTCVLFTFRPLGTLKDFFQSERFRGINSSAGMPMNKAFAERLKLLKEK